MQDAFDCGIRDFGENYIQEAKEKKEKMENSDKCCWHLIGPLQSNKASQAARLFDWVHSLDRLKVATRIGKERVALGKVDMQACIQVNLGDEPSKSGIAVSEAAGFVDEVSKVDGIALRGLMCIPEPGSDRAQKKRRFAELAGLLENCKKSNPDLDTLSMGMSDDYEEAVMEGATIVRIGTALLGPRNLS